MTRHVGLLQSLKRARAKSDQEQSYIEAMIALCASPGPFDRNQFDPGHFTASAFVLSPDQSALLLIFHGKLKRWLQPGGHVEPEDADLRAAVLREVHEECGLAPSELRFLDDEPLDWDVHTIPARGSEPAHAHYDVRYLLHAQSDNAQAGSDAKALRYVPLEQVAEVESDASVMRAVRTIQRR